MSKLSKHRSGANDNSAFGPGGNPRNLDDYGDYVNREFGHMCFASIIRPMVPDGVPPPPRKLSLDFNTTIERDHPQSQFEAWIERLPSMSVDELNLAPDRWKRIAEVRMLLWLNEDGTYTHRKRKGGS